MQEIVIEKKDAGQRLDKYLRKYLPQAPSSFIYRMLRKKNIVLNDAKAEGRELLSEGDDLKIYFSDDTLRHFRKGEKERDEVHKEDTASAEKPFPSIAVLYEDEDILIANKPAGLLSQGDKSKETSLNDWLREHCRNAESDKETFRPSICNRLDRNTSGLVLCAKSYTGSRFLSEQIAGHELGKYYRALVEGELHGEGVLRGLWYKDEALNRVRIENFEGKTPDRKDTKGRYVETHYRSLISGHGYSLMELRLMTGRSHQIRAHMASIGHPLAGDLKYGGHPCGRKKSQILQAFRIVFPEISGDFAAFSGKSFEIDLSPADKKLLNSLGLDV